MTFDDNRDLNRTSSERPTTRYGRTGSGTGTMMAGVIGLVVLLAIIFLVWRGYEGGMDRRTEINATGSTTSTVPAAPPAPAPAAPAPSTTTTAPAPAKPAPATTPAPANP
jgi:hypothetical protein